VSDPAISSITVLTRRALPDWLTGAIPNNKTSTVILDNFLHYPSGLPPKLATHGACIWALGCSSIGMSEQEYTKVTYDYVVSMVSALQSGDVAKSCRDNEPFRFVFISGAGADPTGRTSKPMFARVKVSSVLIFLLHASLLLASRAALNAFCWTSPLTQKSKLPSFGRATSFQRKKNIFKTPAPRRSVYFLWH
jgi:hypothetical protein